MSATTTTRKPPILDSVNITNDADVLAAVREAARLKEIEKAGKEAEKARKALEESIIRPALAGKRFAILRGVKAVTVSTPRKHTSVDLTLLKEAFPEAFEQTRVETTYDFITYSL